jgi:excinuclease UvrABC nuclease subunit
MVNNNCKRSNSFSFRRDNIEILAPEESGIYILWSDLYCLYVGQAQDLRQRLLSHWKKSHNDDVNLWIKALGAKLCFSIELNARNVDLSSLEQEFINRFKPHLNKINARSQ